MQAVDVDVSQDGRVWVMDPMNARLSIFDTTGAFLEGKIAAGGFLMAHWQGGFDQYSNYYAPGYRADWCAMTPRSLPSIRLTSRPTQDHVRHISYAPPTAESWP
jgi:hypothetical protein